MNTKHLADAIIRRVQRSYKRHYAGAKAIVEESLRAFMDGLKIDKDAPIDRLTKLAKALKTANGKRTVRRIADAVYEANVNALKDIMDAIAEAFSEGANVSAWHGVGTKAYTEKDVEKLEKNHTVNLGRRKVDEEKDKRWTSIRLMAAIKSDTLLGRDLSKLPRHVAARITHAAMMAMDTIAEKTLFGASNAGAYQAGLDAKEAGLDVEKTWLGIMDNRIRNSHEHLHGTTVPIDDVFHGLIDDLKYPHDPEAALAETMRCRCRMVIHEAGKRPNVSDSYLLPTEVTAYRKWRNLVIAKGALELEAKKRVRR